MSQRRGETTILVPIDASDPESPSEALVELLGPHAVVILGYYPVPDQSSSDQLRSQFGAQCEAELDEIAARFAEGGATVESVLVFTKDRTKTIDRIAEKHDVDAVLTTQPVEEQLERILVPMRGDETLDSILEFVEQLLGESDATATLFNVATSEDDASKGELIVRGACDRLEEDGIDPERITWEQTQADTASSAIVAAADAYDLLVVGETKPSLRERLLGSVTNTVIDDSPRPVLIVRNNS